MPLIEGLADSLVVVTRMSLQRILEDRPTAFYDVVTMCRDKKYEAFGANRPYLESSGLIDLYGRPHKAICEVVEKYVEGDGLEMRLT